MNDVILIFMQKIPTIASSRLRSGCTSVLMIELLYHFVLRFQILMSDKSYAVIRHCIKKRDCKMEHTPCIIARGMRIVFLY